MFRIYIYIYQKNQIRINVSSLTDTTVIMLTLFGRFRHFHEIANWKPANGLSFSSSSSSLSLQLIAQRFIIVSSVFTSIRQRTEARDYRSEFAESGNQHSIQQLRFGESNSKWQHVISRNLYRLQVNHLCFRIRYWQIAQHFSCLMISGGEFLDTIFLFLFISIGICFLWLFGHERMLILLFSYVEYC